MRLGVYEVTALLGAGGMGEVYKARDTRLDRSVAIKVLPADVAGDPLARERFEREARAVAALNHPHICTLHDVGTLEGFDFLVMELMEGETLAARLVKGALPIAHALQIGIQIVSALDTAHRAGIGHRDLKPGNVFLVRSGGPSALPTAKLLDFGLAKAIRPPVWTNSTTVTTSPGVTTSGSIVGTIQYMAPEQIAGKQVDGRTDIFAFGTVLFEMLTARKAFEAESNAGVMAAILEREPRPLSSLVERCPPALDRLVRICLAKDPDDRWQTARDLLRELRWLAEQGVAASPSGEITSGTRLRHAARLGVPALIAAMVTGIAMWMLRPAVRVNGSPVIRMTVALRGDSYLALSPDGTQLVYGDTPFEEGIRGQLYVRALDSFETKPLPGTEGGGVPFFSPDGRWIGFFAESKLKRISITGGSAQTLCDAPAGQGGSWGPDDTIYFTPTNDTSLWKVSASGGPCEEVTTLDRDHGEVSHRWPQVLPGGHALLFTALTGPAPDEKSLHVLRLDTRERQLLQQSASTGRYVASGHLVYSVNEALHAVPFDLARTKVTGPPVALKASARERTLGAAYAVSDAGTMAYVPGNPQWDTQRMVWVDGNGKIEVLPAEPRPYWTPAVISPDGQRAAVAIRGSTVSIWSYDFSRDTLTPLTSGLSSQFPVWTPDGKRIVYRGTRSGFRNLYWKAVDGSGEEERLTTSPNIQGPGSVSRDGKWLAYYELDPVTGYDIWVLPLDGDRKPQVFLRTPTWEGVPRFSPDGRFLAYMSNESGRPEVYVRPFPNKEDGKWMISTAGGNEPVWSRDGRRLFYLQGQKMLSVDVTTQPVFKPGRPRFLYEGRFELGFPRGAISGYDISLDSQRFLRLQPPPEEPTTIAVVINWFEELKKLVPGPQK